ncbi:sodium-coupled monocarboxylate transporter 1 [Ixodes scapularis]|uniref:sodium-coupled monocarboxylate transporter 1 n=1 Tax=Ixodes scapularis TaxID=6945 RepID=UPI001A9DFBF3|nr:sodium-coupled monocarboxylate transporter 1 [Ixodes scapularis]
MTIYSIAVPYMGSASRIIMMVYSAVTGPFVGLVIMALIFPIANSKGAGIATLLAIILQMWLMGEKLRLGVKPTRMPVTVDYCPVNTTSLQTTVDDTFPHEYNTPFYPFLVV